MRASIRLAVPVAVILMVSATAGAQTPTTQPVVTKDQVDKWMKDLSNWGRWGKDDQRGTFNLITPEKRKQALRLVRDGISVSLAHNLEKEQMPDNPRPLKQEMTLDSGGHAMDLYTIWYHGSTITHLDALCHYSAPDGKLYNGYVKADKIGEDGCRVLSIVNQKEGVFTRGVLVDIPRMRNVPYLEPGTPIYPSDLEAWEKYAGIKIGSGDAVFLRTGRWARRAKLGAWNIGANAAGWHASVMPWLKQRDVALIGNDAVQDVQPSGISGIARPVHQLSIVALGLPLVDVMDLEAVSEQAAKLKRWEFLLTVAPPPVPTGTGFPINPIATF